MHIILEGDAAFKDWAEQADALGLTTRTLSDDRDELRAVYLANGTSGGRPTVFIAGREGIGSPPVALQMTLRMFLAVAAAFRGRAEFEGVDLS